MGKRRKLQFHTLSLFELAMRRMKGLQNSNGKKKLGDVVRIARGYGDGMGLHEGCGYGAGYDVHNGFTFKRDGRGFGTGYGSGAGQGDGYAAGAGRPKGTGRGDGCMVGAGCVDGYGNG